MNRKEGKMTMIALTAEDLLKEGENKNVLADSENSSAQPKPTKKKKRHYTSPHKRNPNKFHFRLTDRDKETIRAVAKYRYLNVSLIHKLLYPPNTSTQVCARRCKKMFHAGYLSRCMPFFQGLAGSSACAYCLDKKGFELMKELGEEVRMYNTASQKSPMFLNHALAVSEFGIIIEKALEDHPFLYLERMIFDFELKAHVDQAIGNQKYRLFSKLTHPISKCSYICYPDTLLVLRKKNDLQHPGKLIFVEIDRGTMGMNALKDKVVGYSLYNRQGVYKKFGKFVGFRVLLQTSSAKRVEAMRRAFTDLHDCDLIWVTDLEQVRKHESEILTAPIWLNADWRTISIVKP